MEKVDLKTSKEDWPTLSPNNHSKIFVEKNKKCEICSFETHKTNNLKKHMKVHKKVQDPTKMPKCSECKKTFGTKYSLTTHFKTHSKTKKCDMCTFETHKTYNLKKHKRTHERVTSDPIEISTCSECEKSFRTKKSLNAHKKTHTIVCKLDCTLCDKTFLTKGNLTAHLTTIHCSNMQVARKALKRARISCDGFKNALKEVIANGWNPEDNLDLLDKMNEAMDKYIKCSDDVIVLHDESGDDEQKEIDTKDKAIAGNLRILNEFKAYRTKFKYIHDNTFNKNKKEYISIVNRPIFVDFVNDMKSNPIKMENNISAENDILKLKMEPMEQKAEVKDTNLNKNIGALDEKYKILYNSSDTKLDINIDNKIARINDSKIKTEKIIYTCEYCMNSFSKKKHLRQHLDTHLKKKTVQCTKCAKRFSRKYNLKPHMKSCSKEKTERRNVILKCDQCQYSVRRLFSLQRHMKIHNKVKIVKKTNCDNCDYYSDHTHRVKRHMAICEQKLERERILNENRKCNNCDYYSRRPRHVRIHMKRCQQVLESKRMKNEKHICKDCGKALKSRNSLERHEQIHDKEIEKPLLCKICQNFFKTEEFLENHLKHHSDFEQTYNTFVQIKQGR